MAPMKPMPSSHLHLWPLPLAAAVMPLIATGIAFALSVQAGHVEACNPFLDGCTSISRAARHGDGNHVFRALMLPCATLQIVFWRLCRRWLRLEGRPAGAVLAWLGAIAGTFLILYATFLGTEGDVYRLLRRYGIIFYFGCTYLALLAALGALHRPPHDRAYRPLLVVALGMLALGLATVVVRAIVDDEDLKDRIDNVLEWHLGLWLTAMFAVFAWRWRRLGVAIVASR